METADFLIVGAGIVGLSVAQELRRRHPTARIVILEKEPEAGCHASGPQRSSPLVSDFDQWR